MTPDNISSLTRSMEYLTLDPKDLKKPQEIMQAVRKYLPANAIGHIIEYFAHSQLALNIGALFKSRLVAPMPVNEPCPLTCLEFSEMMLARVCANPPRNYYISLLVDEQRSSAIFYTEYLQQHLDMQNTNPLTRQPVKEVHYFLTQGSPLFSSCTKPSEKVLLANSLECTVAVQQARLSLLQSETLTDEETFHIGQLYMHDATEEQQKASAKYFIRYATQGTTRIRTETRLDMLMNAFSENAAVQDQLGDLFIEGRSHIAIDYQKAVNHYQKALKIQPNMSNSLIGLGDILTEKEDWHRARDFYERALQLSLYNGSLHKKLGIVYLHLSDWACDDASSEQCIEKINGHFKSAEELGIDCSKDKNTNGYLIVKVTGISQVKIE
ncbi:MAG: Anaphase-promoting complex, cyclosome, subunit 3 [Chlamydiia bacterium]|nr:Anaphase-promoting complex, cyclosome, subunit 3 [Chlamydiia bacterium]